MGRHNFDVELTQLLCGGDVTWGDKAMGRHNLHSTDDGLSTVEIEDVDIELPGNVVHDLMAAVNPLQLSNSYRIGVFIDCLNFLQSCMSS